MTSSVAVLTVSRRRVFTVQPRSANTNVGATVIFSATVGGTGPIGLQWRKDGFDHPLRHIEHLHHGQRAGGDDSGVYSVYASNAAGGVNSSNAILNVGFAPLITAGANEPDGHARPKRQLHRGRNRHGPEVFLAQGRGLHPWRHERHL